LIHIPITSLTSYSYMQWILQELFGHGRTDSLTIAIPRGAFAPRNNKKQILLISSH
jgi:hypothetical protein